MKLNIIKKIEKKPELVEITLLMPGSAYISYGENNKKHEYAKNECIFNEGLSNFFKEKYKECELTK